MTKCKGDNIQIRMFEICLFIMNKCKRSNILARKFLKVNVSEKSAKEAISRPEYLNIYIFTSKKYDQVQKRQYPDQMFEICLFIFVRSKTNSKGSDILTRKFLNTHLKINISEKKKCQGSNIKARLFEYSHFHF